jgi:syntaxin-binding protein 1
LHEASVLSSHLARFVQEELDNYAQWNANFPPPSNRPQGVLLITDRSMDLMAPLVHEFTYQAMAHDLLPINDSGKVFFHMTVTDGTNGPEEKDVELQEKDKVWVDNRHRHMKDTIDKLMGDFQKFLDQNPNFTQEDGDKTSLNAIKDMLAGLPQFQEMKEAYSLHLTMAQDAMNVFQRNKLPDIASVEQTLATGLDEDFRKPKGILDQVVRLLDDDAIIGPDRLRLIMVYVLFRDGVIMEDIRRLLAHANLPPQDGEIITNLDLLGAHTTHGLKDVRPLPAPLFPQNKNQSQNEEYALSRFEPVLKSVLEEIARGTLDQITFPYIKPPIDPNEDLVAAQGSLRAAKPSWAGTARRQADNRQRVVVFVAGGATYSESRACYDVGAKMGRDIVLATSHMLTPAMFVRQVSDLSADRRRLDLPMERPKPKAPAHLFERAVGADVGMGGGGLPGGPGGDLRQGKPTWMNPGTAGPKAGNMGSVAPRRSKDAGAGGLPDGPRAAPQPPPTKALGNMTLSSNTDGGGRSSGGDVPRPSSGDSKPGKLEKGKAKRNIFGLKKDK